MIRKIAITIGLALTTALAFSQGRISGQVMDKDANESIPFANVVVYEGGIQKGLAQTDFDGKYSVSPLNAGKYTVKMSYLGQEKVIGGVIVNSNKTTRLPIEFSSATEIKGITVHINKIVEVDKTSTGNEISAEQIKNAPTRSVTTLVAQSGSSGEGADGRLNIAGNRSTNNLIIVNGVKMNTSSMPNIPMSAIQEIQLITGGVPAKYGDVTGGVINITTKVGAEKMSGGIELETGNIPFLDNLVPNFQPQSFGFWNQNLASVNLSGPIKTRTRVDEFDDGNGNMIKDTVKETVVGFFLSGQYQYAKDPRPTVSKGQDGKFQTGVYTVNDDVLEGVHNNPLVPNGDGYLYSAETLTFDDLEFTKERRNVARNSVQLNGTLEYYPNDKTTVSFGGSLDYRKYHRYIAGYSLMNYNNNPLRNDVDYNMWGRFRQSFGNSSADDSTNSLIKNAYYQVQFDYTVNKFREEDDTHKKNYFRYGHVGNFAYSDDYVQATTANDAGNTNYYYQKEGDQNVIYALTGDSLASVSDELDDIYINSTRFDNSYSFTESEWNPLAARYVSYYQELNGGDPISLNQLFTDGLFFNGTRARIIHGLWYGPGREYGGYSEANEEQYRLSGLAAADVGNHALSFGFEYEQRVRTTYSVNDALGLWFLASAMTNNHLTGFDVNNANVTTDLATGEAFIDFDNTVDLSRQTTFDANLREKLGYSISEEVNVLDLNPDDLSIDMFTANDLIQFGNADWLGYDHTGKRVRGGNTTFVDFFYDFDVNDIGDTVYSRAQAAFQPIYSAFYIQDKFEINDLILRLGLRVDRYDANQVVLKDKYSTIYLDKVNEQNMEDFKNGDLFSEANRSSLIQDDWSIYVDQSSDDLNGNQGSYSVVGFRGGDNWYDVEGNQVRDYSYISSTDPLAPVNASPWFTYAETVDGFDKTIFDERQLDVNGAFEDFKAQINVMPRISFSFPVNDQATFFANYDVLTQRPDPNRTRVRPADFYFLTQRQFMNNPDLRAQKQISYQLGFKQALDKNQNVAMTLSASYQERKNEVTFTSVQYAYPGTYSTFQNLDFPTVKRGEISFDTRRINNVMVNANYTIAFADGTGSGATTAQNLIRNGLGNIKVPSALDYDQRHAVKVNLDYRLDSAGGPTIFGKKLLQNAGASVQLNSGSGRPYTKFANSTSSAVLIGVAGRTTLDGGINTSRLPWYNRANLRVYKNYSVKGRRNALNVYVYVQNLLNTKNIISVYKNTGSPDDDGYIYVSPGKETINTQSEIDLYTARLTTPGTGTAPGGSNYDIPRRIRVGLSYFF